MGFLEILGMVGSSLLSTIGSAIGGGGVPTNATRPQGRGPAEWSAPAARAAGGSIRSFVDPGSANAGQAMDGGLRLQALQNIRSRMGGM